jgi:hypothetical protein
MQQARFEKSRHAPLIVVYATIRPLCSLLKRMGAPYPYWYAADTNIQRTRR